MDRQALIEEALTFIKPTREAILDVLADGKIHRIMDIAEFLGMTPSGVRKVCDALERDGLLVIGDVISKEQRANGREPTKRRAKGVRKA